MQAAFWIFAVSLGVRKLRDNGCTRKVWISIVVFTRKMDTCCISSSAICITDINGGTTIAYSGSACVTSCNCKCCGSSLCVKKATHSSTHSNQFTSSVNEQHMSIAVRLNTEVNVCAALVNNNFRLTIGRPPAHTQVVY